MSLVSTETDLSSGRWRQKQRTRQALIDAARELVALGAAPTVEHAAERAGISRTTAYRYFPNQRSLLVAAHPETVASSLLSPDVSDDPAERLRDVVERFTELISDTEQQQRTMLRLSLEPDAERAALPLRQGRAIGWIEEALEPLRGRLPGDQVHRLALAVRSATGIEALVWLTDVAALPRDEALALMRWSAQALLHAASPTGRRRRGTGHSGAFVVRSADPVGLGDPGVGQVRDEAVAGVVEVVAVVHPDARVVRDEGDLVRLAVGDVERVDPPRAAGRRRRRSGTGRRRGGRAGASGARRRCRW